MYVCVCLQGPTGRRDRAVNQAHRAVLDHKDSPGRPGLPASRARAALPATPDSPVPKAGSDRSDRWAVQDRRDRPEQPGPRAGSDRGDQWEDLAPSVPLALTAPRVRSATLEPREIVDLPDRLDRPDPRDRWVLPGRRDSPARAAARDQQASLDRSVRPEDRAR